MGLNKTSVAGKSGCATLAEERPGPPSPAPARLPGGCATARTRHARPPRPAASSPRRPPDSPLGGGRGGNAERRSAGEAVGEAGRATAAGLSSGVGPGRSPAGGPARGATPPTLGWGRPSPYSLTFLEACALPSSGGRSPEHVRGGVRGRAGDREPGASAGGTTQPGLSPSPRPLPSCPGG